MCSNNPVAPSQPTSAVSAGAVVCSRLPSVTTSTVRDFDALGAHLAAWDRLAWEAPQKIWTLLPGWVDAFLRHRLQPGESWLCSFVYVDGRLAGALPLVLTPHPLLGARWPRLRPVSDDILLAPDCAPMALRALLSEVEEPVPVAGAPVRRECRKAIESVLRLGGRARTRNPRP